MTLSKGDRVRVVKARVAGDAIVGKTGTILGSILEVKSFWLVRLDGEGLYAEDNEGTLLNTEELELIRTKRSFGQFEIYLTNVSLHSGWSYSVRYTLEHQLSLLENPFTFGGLPRDDYGMPLEDAIADAKRRTLEQVAEQIRLKRLHMKVLESAMQSIEEIAALTV